jgi:hypothetical protein
MTIFEEDGASQRATETEQKYFFEIGEQKYIKE